MLAATLIREVLRMKNCGCHVHLEKEESREQTRKMSCSAKIILAILLISCGVIYGQVFETDKISFEKYSLTRII